MPSAKNCRIDVDRTTQILRLEVEPRETWPGQPTLFPMPELRRNPFVSSALLETKAKQFDDGLYAMIEIAVQRGLGAMAPKGALLNNLSETIERVAGLNSVSDTLMAARFAGGSLERIPPGRVGVSELIDNFFASHQSKPLSFYTWTDELRKHLSARPEAAANAIRSEPNLLAAYQRLLKFVTRITNSFSRPHLLKDGLERCILPPSRTPESTLLDHLPEARTNPDSVKVFDTAFDAVRAGRISLKPTADDGWYQHVLYSIEPLICPDIDPATSRLVLSTSYLQHLRNLAHAYWAMARETHVKQADFGMFGCGFFERIVVGPDLTVEPLAEHYLRRARAYTFLRTVLDDGFGRDAWIDLPRLRESGVSGSLGEELASMESLFFGAYATVKHELGFSSPIVEEGRDLQADKNHFAAWTKNIASDPDCGTDLRMMVPVAYNPLTDQMRVWAIFGWTYSMLDVSFVQKPSYKLTLAPGSAVEPDVEFTSHRYDLWQPVVREFDVSRLLDRAEFRELCNQSDSADEIIRSLQTGHNSKRRS